MPQRKNTTESRIKMATVFCNIYHENKWPWGESVKVITPNGMGVVEMSFENNNPGVCYLSGLSVHPSMRRKGIATMLMYCCIDYCKQRGVFRIDLNSVKESFVVDFYKKLGFSPLEEENGFIPMYKLISEDNDSTR